MAASNENNDKRISDVFDDLWKKYDNISSSSNPSVSAEFQEGIKEGIALCEKLIQLVNQLALFSDNENIDEVATNEMKYILLPALLAYFTNKSVKCDRYETVKKCQRFYVDFLTLCKNYGVTDVCIPNIQNTEGGDSTESNTAKPPLDQTSRENKRRAKIQRYKEQKETEARIQELYPLVQKDHVDDEVKREYYTKLLTQWVSSALEDLESIETELPILEHMAKLKSSGSQAAAPPVNREAEPKKQPLRPFIITKNDLQKKVFGLGYPSVPTYTLDEFYESQVAKGQLPDQGSLQTAANDPDAERKEQERSEREKEEKTEQDDAKTLKKARDWDDWKDDHRKGWGNTHNKG